MIVFLALLLHLFALHLPAIPAPAHGVTVSPAAPAPAAVAPTPSHGRASAGGAHSGVPAQRPAAPRSVVVPASPLASSDERPATPAPVTVPGPDSPVCEPGQDPARDGCAQGQLPEETTGRQYG